MAVMDKNKQVSEKMKKTLHGIDGIDRSKMFEAKYNLVVISITKQTIDEDEFV